LADFYKKKILSTNIKKTLDPNYCTFGHLTLMLSLHYFAKYKLLSRLFASGVNVLLLAFVLEEEILSACCNKKNVT